MIGSASRTIRPLPGACSCSWVFAGMLVGLSLFACARQEADRPVDSGATGPSQWTGSVDSSELNIVLITLDTLRADRLSSFGSDVQTPHLDRLAGDGVLFTNASTTVPFTFPAHSSIMTGTYPPFHGVRENVGYYLGQEIPTLAERLGEAGWNTGGFVSAFVLDSRWGIGRGFDHYFDDFDLGTFEDANLGSVQRPGSETIEAALAWLDDWESGERETGPFFLWLHLFDAHDPYTPPEPFRSQYPGAPYDAEVAFTDSLVGDFVGELEARGLLDRSAVIVTADHGEGLGEHGETFHGYFVYESTVHVPLIVRLPEGAAAGSRVDRAVSHVDIAPTVLELAGLRIPDELQGQSLLSATDDAGPGRGVGGVRPGVYAESFYPLLHYGWAPLRALRSDRYKYIEAPRPELFDLSADPEERHGLARDSSPVAAEMAASLKALGESIAEGAAAPAAADLDERTLAQLQALGYMAGPGDEDVRAYDPSVARPDPKEKIHLHRKIMRAQGLVGDGEEAKATEILRQALAEDPNLIDVHQMLGSIELVAESYQTAREHFEQALAIDDRHQPSLFGLATAHLKLGQEEEALVGYRRLVEVAGQDSKATLAIADIEVARGDLQAAEKTLLQSTPPGAPALLFNRLGEVQALAGRPAEAMKSFDRSIAENPQLAEPHFNLAILFEEAGELPRARGEYQAAIERAPKHFQAQFNLGRLEGRMGDPAREIELLEQSIASNPGFAVGHFFLGKSLMEVGELARAEEVTRSGLEIADDSPLGWFVLADILNRRGSSGEAAAARGRELSSE